MSIYLWSTWPTISYCSRNICSKGNPDDEVCIAHPDEWNKAQRLHLLRCISETKAPSAVTYILRSVFKLFKLGRLDTNLCEALVGSPTHPLFATSSIQPLSIAGELICPKKTHRSSAAICQLFFIPSPSPFVIGTTLWPFMASSLVLKLPSFALIYFRAKNRFANLCDESSLSEMSTRY